jgi:hypothetical protein
VVIVQALMDQRAFILGRQPTRLRRRALGGQHLLEVGPFDEGRPDQAGQHGPYQRPAALRTGRRVTSSDRRRPLSSSVPSTSAPSSIVVIKVWPLARRGTASSQQIPRTRLLYVPRATAVLAILGAA